MRIAKSKNCKLDGDKFNYYKFNSLYTLELSCCN